PPPAKGGPLTACPSCSAKWLEGAVSCMDCGYLLPSEAGAGETEEAIVICPNPACGTANPPNLRYCTRCTTPLPTAPGTVLHGRYKVRKLLAMGGFGAVYLAEDMKAGNKEVAIKDMICADPAEFAIRLNFFRREAEILRSLATIPIVPRFIDLIEQDKTAHLIMEFIRGQDLLKLQDANNKQPFPFDQVLEWGKAICDVLQHMHSQSPPLVHRDLKPENVMLLDDRRSIKMIDFGTARDLGKTAKEQMKAKTRVYTEGYAPPEQIVGKPEPRSDLFALAGTMYQLVTGREPEGSFTGREIEAKLASPSGVPDDQRWFYELMKINLAEDVHERYHTAAEIKRDLERRAVTREAACPRCRVMNKAREPYCSGCAAPLTTETPPCHHCGQTNRMGSRFCIHCGNRLR
ncbi:MAG: protein kinase domain-containing protein, partial [Gemmataceae bacterium]